MPSLFTGENQIVVVAVMRHMDPHNVHTRVIASVESIQAPFNVQCNSHASRISWWNWWNKSANYYQNIDFSHLCNWLNLVEQSFVRFSPDPRPAVLHPPSRWEPASHLCRTLSWHSFPSDFKCLGQIKVPRWMFCYEKLKAAIFDEIQSFNQLHDQSDLTWDKNVVNRRFVWRITNK